MKKLTIVLLVALVSCAKTNDKYDPSKYLNEAERKETLAGIVTYIFSAPPYTAMKDRFKPEHKHYYDSIGQRLFSFDRFYADDHKRNYFLVIRPGNTTGEKRAAGGYYDLATDNNFENFRETFVTPQLSDSIVRARGRFLFDEMVKGDLKKYLTMKSYVQWPNPISYYDTTAYEWKMDLTLQDSLKNNPADSAAH